MTKTSPYEIGLVKCEANYVPLSPLSFLERTAEVYPDHVAVIHGDWQITWREFDKRCRQLASALHGRGIGTGDTVAVMLPNVPAMLECHFGVPLAGAVLNTLNTRLDADSIAFMLNHGEAKVLVTDREFAPVIENALKQVKQRPLIFDVEDPDYEGGWLLGDKTYEALLTEGDARFAGALPADEWDPIALNYTSGTTGNPKGVVYSHRGAYLNGLCEMLEWGMPRHSVYLWTLPMFHCNGWCFPWTLAANAGTSVCLRKVDARRIFELIRRHKVTHYCGAPIVHNTLLNAPQEWRKGIGHKVNGLVGGMSMPVAVLEGMERMGFDITHIYGLTEVYGPASICAKHADWDRLTAAERAELNGRQGVRYTMQQAMTVVNPDTLELVPRDGKTMGEIMFRGNLVMKGYLKNADATREAFAGGLFHTGDIAVVQPDGYVKIKDRSKDIIISGGENISSIEVEEVLYRHPAVLLAAVVATPDAKWGETPCAFVELKPGAVVSETEIIDFCRGQLARFKAPRAVVFGELPKTSTGKIQKFLLREKAKSASAIDT